jgi:hypothetical protein
MHFATSLKVNGFFFFQFSSSFRPALVLNQPLTMSTRNFQGVRNDHPARKADNLTADCLENVGSPGPVTGIALALTEG